MFEPTQDQTLKLEPAWAIDLIKGHDFWAHHDVDIGE